MSAEEPSALAAPAAGARDSHTESPRGTAVGSYFVANYPPFSFWGKDLVGEARAALERPGDPATPLGLYLHIPFCRKRCKFCYFRVYVDKNAQEVEEYLDALAREVEILADRPVVRGRSLCYVYFGGGTPSYLSAAQLGRLVERVRTALPWDHADEITFEAEPGTLSRKKLEEIRRIGVTRLSFGVENFDDRILEENGRAHRSAEIFRSWRDAREAGFPQINLDLIAGMVGETDENWHRCIERTIELKPDSVTIYQMELPFNTVFSKQLLEAGGSGTAPVLVAGWEEKRRWVGEAFEALERRGYRIGSGYTALRDDPGRPARFVYRDALWHGADLLGTGVASFSYAGGVHFQNADRLEDYIARLEGGDLPIARALPTRPVERLVREMILQLKLGAIDAGYFRRKFGAEILRDFAPAFEGLRARGLLSWEGDRIALSRAALLQVDDLLPDFYLPEHRGARYT